MLNLVPWTEVQVVWRADVLADVSDHKQLSRETNSEHVSVQTIAALTSTEMFMEWYIERVRENGPVQLCFVEA